MGGGHSPASSGRRRRHPERIGLDPAPGLAGTMAPMPDLLDDLDQRGLVHDTTDRAALAARLAEGPITLYYGCRPDGAEPPPRQPDRADHAAPLPGRRPPAASRWPAAPPGWSAIPGGRSEERNLLDAETLAANVAAIKDADRPDPGPRGALDARRQPRLDRRRAPARLPARRRQARHREPDGRPGEREGPHGERARHLLHGVQLHAPPGPRLRPPAPAPRAASSRSAARTSGATSSRAST